MYAYEDNFLEVQDCQSVMLHAYRNLENLHGDLNFVFTTIEECFQQNNFESKCIVYASRYFDLSKMIGYEIWYNIGNVQTSWHIDKDEKKMRESNVLSLPICTITYYPHIQKNEGGGELLFRDYEIESIRPETNRIVCFDPGISHRVNEFNFERVSVIICPWTYPVEKYIGEKYRIND